MPGGDPGADEVDPLDIIIRSLNSPEARQVVREFIERDFVARLAAKFDHTTTRRAALVAALLMGVGILRKVLLIEPLLEPEGGELERLVRGALRGLMDAKPAAGRT